MTTKPLEIIWSEDRFFSVYLYVGTTIHFVARSVKHEGDQLVFITDNGVQTVAQFDYAAVAGWRQSELKSRSTEESTD